MPIITEIKRQKKGRGVRFNIYLDGSYEFALSDLELSTSGLKVGQVLDAQEVVEYKQQAEGYKAYAWAVRFLAVRMRSTREVRDYLRRKGCEDAEAETVVQRLKAAGLLDDLAFARSWIANRQALRPRSRRMLEQELQAKGVDREGIEESLAELDGEDELQSLLRLIRQKRRLAQYREHEKLIAYLARQGYTYELIKRALLRLDEQA